MSWERMNISRNQYLLTLDQKEYTFEKSKQTKNVSYDIDRPDE